jgi:hypothetical protein
MEERSRLASIEIYTQILRYIRKSSISHQYSTADLELGTCPVNFAVKRLDRKSSTGTGISHQYSIADPDPETFSVIKLAFLRSAKK